MYQVREIYKMAVIQPVPSVYGLLLKASHYAPSEKVTRYDCFIRRLVAISYMGDITTKKITIEIDPNDIDRIMHHGGTSFIKTERLPEAHNNLAKAYRIARKAFPRQLYKQFLLCDTIEIRNPYSIAVRDFKRGIKQEFYNNN